MCLQSNTQTTATKPGSSPNSAAAKPISTPKTTAKLTSLSKTTPTKLVTDEEVKTTRGKPAPAEGESKATVGRRRLHVKGSAASVASTARRASLRSAPEEMTPDSMQTSAVVTPTDVPGATVKRRGRKPAMRNALAETTGTATTATSPSKASEMVSKKPVEDLNDRQPTAETILASTKKEKSTDNLTQAPDSIAVPQQAGSSSTSGDTEEATKPAATRRKVSKVTTVTAADVRDGCQNLFNQKVFPHGWKSGNYELLLLLLVPLLIFLLFQLIKFWCIG